MTEMPWAERTPQVRGRKAEKNYAKQKGARLHPMSGAGSEKHDLSTAGTVIEYKNPTKTHTIKGDDLAKLLDNANRLGKDAQYVIYFEGADITLEGRIHRGTYDGETTQTPRQAS